MDPRRLAATHSRRSFRSAAAGYRQERFRPKLSSAALRDFSNQISIILGATSVLFAALLIITLFFTALMKWESAVIMGLMVSLFFIGCLVTLIGSIVIFIVEIHLSLKALKLEMGHEKPGAAA